MSENASKFEGATIQSLVDMSKDIGEIKEMFITFSEKYEKRLSSLEKWRWLLTGGLIVLAATRFPAVARLLASR